MLRSLNRFSMSPKTLINVYRCTVASTLTGCIKGLVQHLQLTGLLEATEKDGLSPVYHKHTLPSIESIDKRCCLQKVASIIDLYHPCHAFFSHLPSGKRYRSMKSHITGFSNSNFPTTTSTHITLILQWNGTPQTNSCPAIQLFPNCIFFVLMPCNFVQFLFSLVEFMYNLWFSKSTCLRCSCKIFILSSAHHNCAELDLKAGSHKSNF